MLAETHKIIANEIYKEIYTEYNVEMNYDKFLCGSMAPDYLPKYKFIRHYKKESLEYIVNSIVKLIFFLRFANLRNMDDMLNNYFSERLGIITHYLCDYTCYPHAYRMTFVKNMRSHVQYETDLNIYVKNFNFKKNISNVSTLIVEPVNKSELKNKVRNYINNMVDEYMKADKAFDTDLNYALELSANMACFVVETVLKYSDEIVAQYV